MWLIDTLMKMRFDKWKTESWEWNLENFAKKLKRERGVTGPGI